MKCFGMTLRVSKFSLLVPLFLCSMVGNSGLIVYSQNETESAPVKTLQGGVHLDERSVAVMPFAGPVKIKVEPVPPGWTLLWGDVTSSELVGLSRKLDESLFQQLKGKLGSTAVSSEAPSRYAITGSVDEVSWSTTPMANKYTLVVSARLIDNENGQVLAELNGHRVHKAPFWGDTRGGRDYFEKEVVKEAAVHVCNSLTRKIPAQ